MNYRSRFYETLTDITVSNDYSSLCARQEKHNALSAPGQKVPMNPKAKGIIELDICQLLFIQSYH